METVETIETQGVAQIVQRLGRREVETALRQMAERGQEEDLDWLRDFDRLVESTEQEILLRLYDPHGTWQNFFDVTPAELAKLLSGSNGSSLSHSARQTAEELRLIKESWEAIFEPADVKAWFRRPRPRFDGRTPMEEIARGHGQRVLGILERIEAGIHN